MNSLPNGQAATFSANCETTTMASGLLAKQSIPAGTSRLNYAVPVNCVATLNINLANRTASSISVQLHIGTDQTGSNDDFVQQFTIPAHGARERTGIAASAGEGVIVTASADGITARVHGFEEIL